MAVFIEIEKDGAVGRCHPNAFKVWEDRGWAKTERELEKEASLEKAQADEATLEEQAKVADLTEVPNGEKADDAQSTQANAQVSGEAKALTDATAGKPPVDPTAGKQPKL